MNMEENLSFQWEEISEKDGRTGIRVIGCRDSFLALTVPSEIAGLPVVQIGNYAFRGMATEVKIRCISGVQKKKFEI